MSKEVSKTSFNPAEAEEGFSSKRTKFFKPNLYFVSIQPKPKKGLVEAVA